MTKTRAFVLGALACAALYCIVGAQLDTPVDAAAPVEYAGSISATSTNTAVPFGFEAFSIIVANDGTNTVYLTLASTTSTTSKFPVKNGETFSVRLTSPVSGIGLICASTETATVRVGAWR